MSGAPLRVGIVGANPERGWARDAHVPALRALPGFAIAGVSARTRPAAEAAASAFGAERVFGDTFDLVRSPGIDVVAVTVKVPEHLPIVLAALEARKHVYCEWPLGRDLAAAETMTAAAARAGVHAIIGLQGMAAPAVRRAAELVRGGGLGRLLSARVVSPTTAWAATTPRFLAYLNDRRNGATLSTIAGGHTVAVVETVLGRLVEVQARNTIHYPTVHILGSEETIERTSPDHVSIIGAHDGGCVSTIEVAGGSGPRARFVFEVVGTAGELRLTSSAAPGGFQMSDVGLETSVECAPPDPPAAPGLSGAPSNVAELYAMLAAEIDRGARRAPGFAEALHLTRLLDVVERAADTGCRQRLG